MNTNATVTSQDDSENWTKVIGPHRGAFDLRLREIWHYRDLILLLVRRDFVAIYKQSILGPLWHVIQPLMTTLVFTVIFGEVARLSTDGLPKFLFYMAGTVTWSYFAACLTKTSSAFIDNAAVFGKVYFPRLAVSIAILISNLIAFGIQFALFLAIVALFVLRGAPIRPTAWALLTPLWLVTMAGLGLGLGTIVASVTTRYRDLQYLVTFGTQLFMYATPVVYPLSVIPLGKYQLLSMANPMTSIIESVRRGFLGTGTVSLAGLLYSFFFMVVVLLVAVLIFNRVERTFMDTV